MLRSNLAPCSAALKIRTLPLQSDNLPRPNNWSRSRPRCVPMAAKKGNTARSPWLQAMAGAALVLCFPLFLRAGTEGPAMFLGDPAHSGSYSSAAPRNLAVKWTFRTGEAIVSSPTLLPRARFTSEAPTIFSMQSTPARENKNGSSNRPRECQLLARRQRSCRLHPAQVWMAISTRWMLLPVRRSGRSPPVQGERRHSAAGIDYAAAVNRANAGSMGLFSFVTDRGGRFRVFWQRG